MSRIAGPIALAPCASPILNPRPLEISGGGTAGVGTTVDRGREGVAEVCVCELIGMVARRAGPTPTWSKMNRAAIGRPSGSVRPHPATHSGGGARRGEDA